MPVATQKNWMKSLARLPWWRSEAYFKQRLAQSVRTSTAIENGYAKSYFNPAHLPAGSPEGGQFAPSGGNTDTSSELLRKGYKTWPLANKALELFQKATGLKAEITFDSQGHPGEKYKIEVIKVGLEARRPGETDNEWLYRIITGRKLSLNGNLHVNYTVDGHSYASTQLELPPDLQASLRSWVTANVSSGDLSPLEKQDDAFHVTVLYGLRTDEPRDVERALLGCGAAFLLLGPVQAFTTNPAYDVLYVSLLREVGVTGLRQRLTQHLPWTATQASYIPHVALAYVKKGASARLIGDTSFVGQSAVIDRLRFSSSANVTTWVSLLPTQAPAIESGRERLSLDGEDVHIPTGLTTRKKKRSALELPPALGVGAVSYAKEYFNPAHLPAGSPEGGQFAPAGSTDAGGGRSGEAAVSPSKTTSPSVSDVVGLYGWRPKHTPLPGVIRFLHSDHLKDQIYVKVGANSWVHTSFVGGSQVTIGEGDDAPSMDKHLSRFHGKKVSLGVSAIQHHHYWYDKVIPGVVPMAGRSATSKTYFNPNHVPAGSTDAGGERELVGFHGTAKSALNSILKTGLTAGSDARTNTVYLSSSLERAKQYADLNTRRGEESEVLEVHVPADRSSEVGQTSSFDGSSMIFSFAGDIPPEWIKGYSVKTVQGWQTQKRLVQAQRALIMFLVTRFKVDNEKTFADLHWTQDEMACVVRSIVADHPEWTRQEITRELRRRIGVLRADGQRRMHLGADNPGGGNGSEPRSGLGIAEGEANKQMVFTERGYSGFDESEHPRENNGEFAPKGEGKIVTDPAKVQEIKNSIAEGQLTLRTGTFNGRRLSAPELLAVRRQVEGDLARIGQSRIQGKHVRPGFVIKDVTPEGYGPKYSKDEGTSFSRSSTPYERKVDFAAIKNELNVLEAQGRERVRGILVGARDKLIALVTRKHKDGSLTTSFVNGLEFRGLGQLVPTLREILRVAFQHGERHAKQELRKGRLGLIKTHAADSGAGDGKGVQLDEASSILAMVRSIVAAYPTWTRDQIRIAVQRRLQRARAPMLRGGGGGYSNPSEESHAYLVSLTPEGLPPTKALEFFDQKATLWGTDVRDPLLSDVKNALYNAIKTGESMRDTMSTLESLFLGYVGSEDQLIDGEQLTPYRLETLIRTNATEAFNEGRKSAFQSSIDDGFVIGLQYTAILDERTTEVCRYLDGKILPPEGIETDELTPPRHYNCRSMLSSVLRTEGPVEFITPEEVAHGRELSGVGFAEAQTGRMVETMPSMGQV